MATGQQIHSLRLSCRDAKYFGHPHQLDIHTQRDMPCVLSSHRSCGTALSCYTSWQYLSESRFPHVTGQDYTMFALFLGAAEICLVISTLYHLQMSHPHETERFWLRMNLIGIIIAIEGTRILGINYILPCEPKWQAGYWSTVSNSHSAHSDS